MLATRSQKSVKARSASGSSDQLDTAMSASPARRVANRRKFYLVGNGQSVSRASGFDLVNEEALFQGRPPAILVPPPGQRGFRDYPEAPAFLSDSKRGRTHWDKEEYCGYWFISDRMKSVLENVDAEAFVFLKCKVQLRGGTDGPVRWLCDIVRVLDALDEEKSKITIRSASDGSKVYNFLGRVNLVFKEDAVESHHIFRMKYYNAAVICDEQVRLACKAAGLKGIGFKAQRLRVRDTAFTFCLRAETHHTKGDFDSAIDAYTEAIRLGSRDRLLTRYFYHRGHSYFKRNDFDRAIADYGEVIRLNPIGPDEGAIADQDLAIRITRLAGAYYSRGKTYLKKGELDLAADDLEAAKRLGYDEYLPRPHALSGPT